MNTLRLMIIDSKGNTVEVELNSLQYRSMGIDLSKVKRHKSKRELNSEITRFLESFKEEK